MHSIRWLWARLVISNVVFMMMLLLFSFIWNVTNRSIYRTVENEISHPTSSRFYNRFICVCFDLRCTFLAFWMIFVNEVRQIEKKKLKRKTTPINRQEKQKIFLQFFLFFFICPFFSGICIHLANVLLLLLSRCYTRNEMRENVNLLFF